jgi:hypothetical protein
MTNPIFPAMQPAAFHNSILPGLPCGLRLLQRFSPKSKFLAIISMKRAAIIISCLAVSVLPTLVQVSAAVEAEMPDAASFPAVVTKTGDAWTLENNTLCAAVKFKDGSVDLTRLFNKRAGKEMLTGAGPRSLFRHTVDGEELAAQDGQWILGNAQIADITAFGQHWGKSLTLDLARPASQLTVSLVFEIFDGDAGLRYGSFIHNDDATRARVISSSDILTLNVPDAKHTID